METFIFPKKHPSLNIFSHYIEGGTIKKNLVYYSNVISIVITSFREPETIGRAIAAFEKQSLKEYEILIVAPDRKTLDVARSYSLKNKRVKIIKDPGKGKPSALNIAFRKARSNIVVLSDGDVFVEKNSVKFLINNFKNSKIGAVSGRVKSSNDKSAMFGYWAFLSTQGFHKLRMRQMAGKRNIDCSGYYYAVRKELVDKLPSNILADDAYISRMINKKGQNTIYDPRAVVNVKYPTNLRDWIKQKKRTTAKFYQLGEYYPISKTRAFGGEIISGLQTVLEIRNPIEVIWFLFLSIMRAYIWFRVFFDVRLWKRSFSKNWERVESTK